MKKFQTRGSSHPVKLDTILFEEGVNKYLITEDFNVAGKIIYFDFLVKEIIKTDKPLFFLCKNSFTMCKNKQLYRYIKEYVEGYSGNEINKIFESFPIHKFSPYVDLFIKELKTLKDTLICFDSELSKTNRDNLSENEKVNFTHKALNQQVAILNDFLTKIRNGVKSKEFKAILTEYEFSSEKNYKSLTKYINGLFEVYSRLLVLRIDFGYRKDDLTTNAIITPIQGKDISDKHLQAVKDREKFFNNIRSNEIFKHKVGYVWKLEFASRKGFHYHIIFFFDGSKVREDVTIAKMIGEYWNKIITQGAGVYFNCNAEKTTYKNCGIGMIDHSDTEKRKNLDYAAEYLTKTDTYAKINSSKLIKLAGENQTNSASSNYYRSFGKGELPKKKLSASGKKLGRPRKVVSN